jgi:hypothetical protein
MILNLKFLDYVYELKDFIDKHHLHDVVEELFGKPLERITDESDFFIITEVLSYVPETYWVLEDNGFFAVYQLEE